MATFTIDNIPTKAIVSYEINREMPGMDYTWNSDRHIFHRSIPIKVNISFVCEKLTKAGEDDIDIAGLLDFSQIKGAAVTEAWKQAYVNTMIPTKIHSISYDFDTLEARTFQKGFEAAQKLQASKAK